jgi:hypothetical protein
MSAEAQNALAKPDVERESFVETFHVREKGRRYEVAANAIANRAMMQVNVAKLRSIGERALKPYLDDPTKEISPKEFKILAEGVELVENLSAQAYSDSKTGGNLANALERLVFSAAKGAAQGASTAGTSGNTPDNRMRRMRSLIGKAKPVTPAPEETEVMEVE